MSELINEEIQVNFQRLGVQYQLKLIGELFIPNNINKKTNNLFVEEVIRHLDPNYFEAQDMRQLVVLYKDYFNEYNVAPNMDNIYSIINQKISNEINRNELIARLTQIKKIITDRKNGNISDDSQATKDNTLTFIKQQEFLKAIKHSEEKLSKGIVSHSTIEEISSLFKKVNTIGEVKLLGKRLFEDDDDIFNEETRTKFKSGFPELDKLFEPYGAFDRSEIFCWAAPSGHFKSTGLVLTGYENYIAGFNVLHLVAEGKEKDIRAKYYAKLTGIPVTDLSKQKELAKQKIEVFKKREGLGTLKIIRVEDGITTSRIKSLVKAENEKLSNGKIDLIIFDYFEGLGADKAMSNQVYENQRIAITEMENYISITGEEIGYATAVQIKTEHLQSDILFGNMIAGSQALLKKSSTMISVSHLDNIAVLKSRHKGSGVVFENCEINRDILTVSKAGGDYSINDDIIKKAEEFEKNTDENGNFISQKLKGVNFNE